MKSQKFDFCNQANELAVDFAEISSNEKRTLWVVLLTTVMMAVEIAAGHITGSMALLADGYHMASHAGALGIAYLVYRLARSHKLSSKLNFGTGKLLPLGGYTSAVGLGIIAVWMAFESVQRLLHPVSIEFNEAIVIAGIGLLVNIVSAGILGLRHHHEHDDDHHDEQHESDHHGHSHHQVEDHNHRSALVHVLADALTSGLAIFALMIGKYFSAVWTDPMMGIIGSAVILRWAYSLSRATARELLDAHPKGMSLSKIKQDIERDGHRVFDLHAWHTGPSNIVCMLAVAENPQQLEGTDFRDYFRHHAKGLHLSIEKIRTP
ncbi:MAG: CDF family Co(II)/Ni(II) efflux transporter DmeF [Bdellovibrio sp.]|nr:CDF family Co(II)/Ni(II) efflux transporter DmeF [Bdellovibrio sp.]